MRRAYCADFKRCVLAALAAGVLGTAACGARSALEFNPSANEIRDETLDPITDAAADAASAQGSNGCAWPATLDYMSTEGGTGVCVAGAELLSCDVAQTGETAVMGNFCVTSEPNCSAVSDPGCQSQCGSGEFGVLCAEFSSPQAAGCRVIWPSPTAGADGFAFCCTCG